ncbi:hypothetical protein ACFVWY_20820 [Streptomyces sp. NPDC058195]
MKAILNLQNLDLPEGPQDDQAADGLSSISMFCNNGGGTEA